MRLPAVLVTIAALGCASDGHGQDAGESGTDGGATSSSTSATPTSGIEASSASASSTTVGDDSSTGGSSGSSATSGSQDAGETATSSESGASSGSSDSESGGDGVLELDPATMTYFDLPINSIRYAVAGEDIDSDTCVTIVWFYGGGDDPWQEVCGMEMFSPYVTVTPGATAPCMQWDYQGNVMVDAVEGCVQFVQGDPLSAVVDLTITVSGGAFSGTIIASNQ